MPLILPRLQRLLWHHPLTKSHIEDALPGTARETRGNTAKNRRLRAEKLLCPSPPASSPGSSAELTPPASPGASKVDSPADSLLSGSDGAPPKRVNFCPAANVIGVGDVKVNFASRRRRPTAGVVHVVVDPAATPFLDSLQSRSVKK